MRPLLGVLACYNTIFLNNKPWFQIVETDDRPVVGALFDSGYVPPFKVFEGETVYIRDDGSWGFAFVKKNRILFPNVTCRGILF